LSNEEEGAMKDERIEFASAGHTFAGFFFEPATRDAERRAGVMVLHGGAGVGAHEHDRACMLAELGYVAFVPDLFGEKFETREHGVEVITRLVGDPPALRARLGDALACMLARSTVDPSRVAAIGFCFGGLAALELARAGADLRAVVSFHGGLTAQAPAEPGRVRAAIVVCTGAADPFVPREHRSAFEDEMNRADADWQLHIYANAMHGFTERNLDRPGARYHEVADRRSWQTMRALFDETLAG
jgi:dienelactone hydrolase